jgi:hypothetical protein
VNILGHTRVFFSIWLRRNCPPDVGLCQWVTDLKYD